VKIFLATLISEKHFFKENFRTFSCKKTFKLRDPLGLSPLMAAVL